MWLLIRWSIRPLITLQPLVQWPGLMVYFIFSITKASQCLIKSRYAPNNSFRKWINSCNKDLIPHQRFTSLDKELLKCSVKVLIRQTYWKPQTKVSNTTTISSCGHHLLLWQAILPQRWIKSVKGDPERHLERISGIWDCAISQQTIQQTEDVKKNISLV